MTIRSLLFILAATSGEQFEYCLKRLPRYQISIRAPRNERVVLGLINVFQELARRVSILP
ncbi:MAG: hypothetical protein ACI9SJ_001644 [Flavobacteriaceae bacterium]|jgi:hypothetical protein